MDALTFFAAELLRDRVGATFVDPAEQVDFDQVLMHRKRADRDSQLYHRLRVRQEDGRPVGDATRRCALYRHFDATGVLLYVGISEDLAGRGQQHARSAIWVQFVVETRATWYPSRHWAERAEVEAIRAERPLFNVAHNEAVGSAERVRFLVAKQAWDLLDPRARRGA